MQGNLDHFIEIIIITFRVFAFPACDKVGHIVYKALGGQTTTHTA